MANILYFNLTNVKEAKGGRPQTVMFTGQDVKPNGTIVTLGETMEKDARELDHVRKVEFIKTETAEVIGKWVIASPEIVVEQYRLIDGKAWKYVLEPNETYAAYELQKHDRLEYSEAHFENFAGMNLQVGEFVKIDNQGKFVKGGTANDSAFRVVSILDVNKPVVLEAAASSQAATFIPQLGKMIKLEVVR